MAVLPEFRGIGVDTEIFRNLLEIANNMNCETMILYASKLGKRIYKKFGFQGSFYGTMYQLSMHVSDFGIQNKVTKFLERLPEWLLTLDEKAMGFDRSLYLNMRNELGAKILVVQNEGYGLLVNNRLGPLIAINYDAALQIIKKSKVMGADHLIITNHEHLPQRIFNLINLVKKENEASLKMAYGKKLSENLDLLYAIGTYAKG